MTRDEFIVEYHKVATRAMQISKKARREGLLTLEEMIDREKVVQRDIFEYGMRFVVDGTDATIIRDLLEMIISHEDGKYARQLMVIKCEAVLSIQAGDNPRILAFKLNACTDLSLAGDPALINWMQEEENNEGFLSQDEINTLLKDRGVV